MEATPSGAVNSLFSRPVGLPYAASAHHNVKDAALLGPSKSAASQASTVHFQWLAHVHTGVGRGQGGLNGSWSETTHRGGGRSPSQSQTVGRKGPAMNWGVQCS